ncbi:class I SAM-dependent methyltransferase [Alsobacter sp. SYSU BS001988]
MASSWRDFFDGEHSIYVNARHKALHDRMVARDVAAIVASLAPPGRPLAVLDFGCGEATEAQEVARVSSSLILSDAAPAVLARVRERYRGDPRIRVLDPGEVEALAPGSLDVVAVNSLLQYLPRAELQRLLEVWRELLAPGGHLVVGDVVPPDVSPLTDAAALLRFGWQGGFLAAAGAGLVRTALSDYRKLRAELGLSTYDENAMLSLLENAGFEARRRRPNIGHNQARMTFVATRPD